MNVSEPFILRPVGTTLFMVAILLSGIVAYSFLPLSTLAAGRLSDDPGADVLSGRQPGSDDVVGDRSLGAAARANARTEPDDIGELRRRLDHHACNSLSISSLDVAEQEVQAAINAANNLLPSDLPIPPVYAKINPADAPILTLAVTSKSMSLIDSKIMSETRLAQKISQLSGVGLVSISGGHRPAVRIQFNPQALAAYGLNIDDVRTTIGNFNVNTPKGNFDGPAQATTINANDQIENAAQYANTVIAYRNGEPGEAFRRGQRRQRRRRTTKLGAWANTTPAIILNVQRQPGANIIQVVDRIKALLPQHHVHAARRRLMSACSATAP